MCSSTYLIRLTFRGTLMHPRKSSAFSSEPDDADPLERTDFAICLKYLINAGDFFVLRMTVGSPSDFLSKWKLRISIFYLPIPRSPLTSLSFLQASATDTSSSWSLQRGGRPFTLNKDSFTNLLCNTADTKRQLFLYIFLWCKKKRYYFDKSANLIW